MVFRFLPSLVGAMGKDGKDLGQRLLAVKAKGAKTSGLDEKMSMIEMNKKLVEELAKTVTNG